MGGIGIKVKLKSIGDYKFDTKVVMESFWFNLSTGLKSLCRGAAGKWLRLSYINEIYEDEHVIEKDGFILFFNNPAGMCDVSSGVTLHMARLIIYHNLEKFSKKYKWYGCEIAPVFDSVEKIKKYAKFIKEDLPQNKFKYGMMLLTNSATGQTKQYFDCGFQKHGWQGCRVQRLQRYRTRNL